MTKREELKLVLKQLSSVFDIKFKLLEQNTESEIQLGILVGMNVILRLNHKGTIKVENLYQKMLNNLFKYLVFSEDAGVSGVVLHPSARTLLYKDEKYKVDIDAKI